MRDKLARIRSDFSDIRFTKSDAVTQLSYWIESISGSVASFWVRYDAAASGNVTIYVYYGCSSASSRSNGQSTLMWFEDFSGASLDTYKWNYTEDNTGSGSHSFSLTNGNLMTTANSTSSGWQGYTFDSQDIDSTSFQLYVKSSWSSLDYIRGGGEFAGGRMYESPNGQHSGYTVSLHGDYYVVWYRYKDGTSYENTGAADYASGNEQTWVSFLPNTFTVQMTGTYSDGPSTQSSATCSTPWRIRLSSHISYWTNAVSVISRYDTVWVRKYQSTEPTHGSWGFPSRFDDTIVVISYSSSDSQNRTNVNEGEYFYVTLHWQKDGSNVDSGTVSVKDIYLNSYTCQYVANGQWRTVNTLTRSTVGTILINQVVASSMGISSVNQNSKSIVMIYDKLNLVIKADGTNYLLNGQVNITVTATYMYSGTRCSTWTITMQRDTTTNWASRSYPGPFNDKSSSGAHSRVLGILRQ